MPLWLRWWWVNTGFRFWVRSRSDKISKSQTNMTWMGHYKLTLSHDPGPVAISDKTFYGEISQSLKGTRSNVNSLAPGRSECDSKNAIFNPVLLFGIFRSTHDNAHRWMPQNLTDDKSTLVQVMAWCRLATSHYPNQCWFSSLSLYGVTRHQRVKMFVSLWNLTGTSAANIVDSRLCEILR